MKIIVDEVFEDLVRVEVTDGDNCSYKLLPISEFSEEVHENDVLVYDSNGLLSIDALSTVEEQLKVLRKLEILKQRHNARKNNENY